MNTKKEKILAIMVCVVMWAAVFAVAVPATASGATIIVPDDYSTIQQAIDDANSGDTVYVHSGTYYEHVTIGKSLTLEGENRETTIIDGSGSGNVVYLGTSNVMVTGFTIRNGNRGVYSYGASYSKIIDCVVTHNYQDGIKLENSPNSEVKNCDVSDKYSTVPYEGYGIFLWGSGNSVIEDIRLFDDKAFRAFTVYHSSGTLIKNIEMFNNMGGLIGGFGSYEMVNINIHDNEGFGVNFNGASNGSLRDSVIRSVSGDGVSLIFGSCNNVIEGNIIGSNSTGIRIGSPGVSNNRFYHNDMINNVHQITGEVTDIEAQYWDNGYPSGGNYWSDYDYNDMNDLCSGPNQDVPGSDGIWDTPYWITEIAKDNYPLVDPCNILQAAIDIKPGSCPNPLNVKNKGVLPVAILGSEDFDVNAIDVASIRLEDVAPIRSILEDAATPVADGNECECTTEGPDGYLDLTLKFETEEIVNTFGEVNDCDVLVLTLTGLLQDGKPIKGADCVLVLGKFKPLNKADIDKDGIVDFADFTLIAENWLQSSIVQD